MTRSAFLPSISRRRLLLAASTVAALSLAAPMTVSQAIAADKPVEGGSIVFLIDSLGDTWIPNNSAISSFQGHIWAMSPTSSSMSMVTERSAPGLPKAGSRMTRQLNSCST